MDSDVRMSTGEQAGGWMSSELVSGVGGAEMRAYVLEEYRVRVKCLGLSTGQRGLRGPPSRLRTDPAVTAGQAGHCMTRRGPGCDVSPVWSDSDSVAHPQSLKRWRVYEGELGNWPSSRNSVSDYEDEQAWMLQRRTNRTTKA